MSDPSALLDDLKVRSIEDIPDEITPDMPEDLRQLVTYKQEVVEAVAELNSTAEVLAQNPEDEAAREAFVAANERFTQAGEAYQYSWDSIEDKSEIQAYIDQNNLPSAAEETIPAASLADPGTSTQVGISRVAP